MLMVPYMLQSRPAERGVAIGATGALSKRPKDLQIYPSQWTSLEPPLSREELGRATWAFLHTMAAKLPDELSDEDVTAVENLLFSLARLYPCESCAYHFQQFIDEHPFRTPGSRFRTRVDVARWLCEAHNAVNARNDKPLFPCTEEELWGRWSGQLRDDCGCSRSDGEADSDSARGSTAPASQGRLEALRERIRSRAEQTENAS